MTYRREHIYYYQTALKEWEKLSAPIKSQFKKKLAERLLNPRVPSAKLRGYSSVYKIKLRSAGYLLVYEVVNDELIVSLLVVVLAVGKREKGEVYKALLDRK